MFKKKLLLISFFSLFTFFTHPNINLLKENPWGYLEEKLIVEPIELEKSPFTTIVKAIPESLVSIGAGLLTYKLTQNNNEIIDEQKFYRNPKTFSVFAGLCATIPTILVVNYYAQYYIDTITMIDFVREWQEHKTYIPPQFHEAFEELHETYLKDGTNYSFVKKALNVLRMVRRALYEKFPHKYPEKLKQYDNRVLCNCTKDSDN